MPERSWRVIAFERDEFSLSFEDEEMEDPRVNYWISLDRPSLPPWLPGDLLWFQHSFGMWGRVNTHFLSLLEEGKRRGKKIGASFHTIHFQSEETPWGMQEKEFRLLAEVLPLLDFATVFTQGAYGAVAQAFPQYREKVVVLRHGVHRYPRVKKREAREKLFDYLIECVLRGTDERARLRRAVESLSSRPTLLLGNFGFITQDKDPLRLYELGRLVRAKLPSYKVVTLFVGKIQERKDKKSEVYLPILEELRSVHDGKENLFYEDYLPEAIFPFAFGALDFAVFWCENATQSGRMAHAQGTGVPVVGRKWEGVGETLELSGLPAAQTLEELAEQIAERVKEPKLLEQMAESSERYADAFSFSRQAKKHLVLEEAIRKGTKLPALDGVMRDDFHIGTIGPWGFRGFRKSGGEVGVRAQRC